MSKDQVFAVCATSGIVWLIAITGQWIRIRWLEPLPNIAIYAAALITLGQIGYLIGSNRFGDHPKGRSLRLFDWLPLRGRWVWGLLAIGGALMGICGIVLLLQWFFAPKY